VRDARREDLEIAEIHDRFVELILTETRRSTDVS